ncbi:MAG: hypothetical protein ABIA93_04185 [Candidatus Woesearchaeota archaeon]
MLDSLKSRLKKPQETQERSQSMKLPEPASEVLERQHSVPVPKMQFPTLPQPSPVVRARPVHEEPSQDEIKSFEAAFSHIGGSEKQVVLDNNEPKGFQYGFFHETEAALQEHGHTGLDAQAIVSKMKQFHYSKDDGKPFYFRIGDIHDAVATQMSELKDLEAEWISAKDRMEEAEQAIIEKEQSIAAKITDVQKLLKQAKMAERLEISAPEEKAFVLHTNARIRSLLELLVALRTMSDATFSFHVTESRNDFATWIRTVIQDEDVASKVQIAMSREAMIDVLTSI